MKQKDDHLGGIGLALSGGGFRGVLFHLGGVWRLNELGWLPRIDTFSGISGGSIVAALVGLNWSRLEFSSDWVAGGFRELIAEPIRRFCGLDIDLLPTLLNGLLNNFGLTSNRVSDAYGRQLFGEAALSDLPANGAGPRVIINACNLRSGAPVRFCGDAVYEGERCLLTQPAVRIADAVAASSAYPPFLSPVVLDLPSGGGPENATRNERRLVLADGALFDPLGLEAIWDEHRVLLVSDATTMLAHWPRPSSNWFRQLNRAILIQCDASSLLQRRNLLQAFESSAPECSRGGAYWCNSSLIGDHGADSALATDTEHTAKLGRLRTRLNRFSPEEQGMLINWGYAMCDAALRGRGLCGAEPGRLPFPEHGTQPS